MSLPDPSVISYMIATALRRADENRPRSVQKAEGRLGPSDMGFCRERARLVTVGTTPSDSTNGWPAMLGTVVGEMAEQAIKATYPDWLLGNLDKIKVTAVLPNGAEISGTPDVIVPEWNAVLDLKTKDGFGLVRREPWTTAYRFQTWCYATGAVRAGLLDGSKPLHVGLVYLDRSGKIADPFVVTEPLNPLIEDELSAWVDDVLYAVQHNEQASLDIAAPVCEQICEFFTVCRGDLPMAEADQITDPHLIDAIAAYIEGRELIKEGGRIKEEAAEALAGVNGRTDQWLVRWTKISESFIPARERASYMRLDVRKARGR